MIVLVLAAGQGSRFTASGGLGHKLDALIAGKPVLDHVLRAVDAAGLESFVVRPPGGTGGMGESIAMGVQHTRGADGWLILPGDLPLVTGRTIAAVAQALAASPVVVPHYQGRAGHPVGFQRCHYRELTALHGDRGAASIVRAARLAGRALELAVDDRGAVLDVDSYADLAMARQLFQCRQT